MKEVIYNKLQALEPVSIEVFDDSDSHIGHAGHTPGKASHFELRIVSKKFANMSKIEMHQEIYKLLKDEMVSDIHALQIDARAG